VRGHAEPEKENNERWLLTYSDLITLLLAFFIILFSMSNVDKEKYKAVIESLGSVFGAVQGTAAPGNGKGGDINFPQFSPSTTVAPSPIPSSSGASLSPSPSASAGQTPLATSTPDNGGIGNAIEVEKMNNVKQQVEGLLQKENLQNDVTVTVRDRGLEISINSRVLFNSGSADLTLSSRDLVNRIADILTPLADNQICVEGHTDNRPIHTSQFPSNWELSAARAVTVLKILLANPNLKPGNLSSIGYGEYRPIASNDTPDGRAKNRRVTIVILKDDYNKSIDIKPGD
jgi:chemotaxis protein MotB